MNIISTSLADIYLEVDHATDASGTIVAAPVILTYTPYAILGRNGDAAHWNSLGYTRATADVIGTGNSGGCWDYGGPNEKQTAKEVIEWIAQQPWSDGKIGMLGGSYEGTTQYAAAVMHPVGLVTIVPEAAIDRWYDYAFAGGIRYLYTTEPFGYEGPGTAGDEGIDTTLGFDFGLAIPPPIDNTDPNWASRVASKITVCSQVEHTMEGYSTTPDYDQFWLDRDYLKDLPSVTIPVLVASNFGEWNVKQVDGWQAYHALTNSVFARMYFGSRWHGHGVHAADGTWALSPDAIKAPPGSPQSTFQWTGANKEANDTLQPFAYNGGFLSFESPVLRRDVRIFGEPVLHLWSTVQRQWVTYTPLLIDFDPSRYTGTGAATTATTQDAIPALTRGWLDSRYRSGLSSESLVTPGSPFSEDVSLWPQDYTVHTGHRLILVISTEMTEWDVPEVYDGTPGAPTVQLDYEDGQGYITLPIAGAVPSGDSLFNGSAPASVPDVPLAPLLILAGLAGAVAVRARRLIGS